MLRQLQKAFLVSVLRSVKKTISGSSNMSVCVKMAASETDCDSVTIAALQLCSTIDKHQNFLIASQLIQEAAQRKAKMIFLPENFDFIPSGPEEGRNLSETLHGPLIRQYQELAVRFNVYLSLGGFHDKVSNDPLGRVHNCHLVINPIGRIVATYNKMHLFDVQIDARNTLQESRIVLAGESVTAPVDTAVGKVGLAVCYDLRFPQLSSCLREMGADILTYPAAFTKPTGKAHWEVLLRTRAIENQCYVVAAAQCGEHNEKRASYGHTMIVDPQGEIMAQCTDEKTGAIFANVSLSRLKRIRSAVPFASKWKHNLIPLSLGLGQALPIGEVAYEFGPHVIPASTVFYRSLYSFAFVNISPLVPGHILVCPLEKLPHLEMLRPEQLCDMFSCVHKIAPQLETMYSGKSLTISTQDGTDAGQTVPHVHIHMLPRKPNDFAKKDIMGQLQEHDKIPTRKFRSYEEMSEEAMNLRTLFY